MSSHQILHCLNTHVYNCIHRVSMCFLCSMKYSCSAKYLVGEAIMHLVFICKITRKGRRNYGCTLHCTVVQLSTVVQRTV